MLLGLKPENVRVIFRRGSGCYGLNGADTVTYDAALLSQAVGKPVRVQLTRKDEMAWENYGNAFVIDERAGLDAQGNIVAWDHEAWSPGLGNRPGIGTPGNVITGFARWAFQPEPFTSALARAGACHLQQQQQRRAVVSRGRVGGAAKGTGKVASERVLVHNVVSPFWTGPLRSPARLQNTFAHECFMDELAAQVKADPVEYRLRHLARSAPERRGYRQPRRRRSGRRVRRPSPAIRQTGIATGRGVACVATRATTATPRMVVEVEVDQDTGKVARQADCA